MKSKVGNGHRDRAAREDFSKEGVFEQNLIKPGSKP